jgi:hypothetical protein
MYRPMTPAEIDAWDDEEERLSRSATLEKPNDRKTESPSRELHGDNRG